MNEKMITQRVAAVAMLIATSVFSSEAVHAQGLLDGLDPCIAADKKLKEVSSTTSWTLDQASNKLSAATRKALKENETAKATPEFAKVFTKYKQPVFRDYFDKNVYPGVKDMLSEGTTKDAAFEKWLSVTMARQEIVEERDRQYRHLMQSEIVDAQSKGDKAIATKREQLEAAQKELDAKCPADFGNQALRGTLTLVGLAVQAVVAPINIVAGNIDAAKNESGEIDKALRAATGISVDAIKKEGLSGGENSFFRKNLGIRF